jgi:hypothetical protein
MEEHKRFEVFGTLTKTETVFTIDHKVMPGTLVFEALRPFSGYYSDSPMSVKPVYLYLALEEQYTLVDIIRASEKVQREFSAPFDAGKGFLEIFDEKYNVLRIRHLRDYDLLGKLQESFTANGIRFLHKAKKVKNADVRIRIIKFFSMEEIGPGIYLDKREKYHAYIQIPRHLNWEDFECVTNKVKYNWEESNFDGAKGAFYHEGQLHEVVRIYSNKIGPEYLKKLRKLYLEKME